MINHNVSAVFFLKMELVIFTSMVQIFNRTGKLFITLLMIVVCSTSIFCQTSRFEKLDKSDGLPSNFVYRVVEDMKGNIWMCTDGGVCKYDGKTMKCFDQTDGLPDKDIFKITLDEIGRLWLIHASNKIAFIQNDSVHVIPTKSQIGFQRQFCNSGADQGIQIGTDFYSIDADNNVNKTSVSQVKYHANMLLWHDMYLLSYSSSAEDDVKEVTAFSLNGDYLQTLSEVEEETQSIIQYHQPTNTFQIYTGNHLYIYDTLLVYQEVLDINLPTDVDILSALKDSWGNIWVCTRNGVFIQSYSQRVHDITYFQKMKGTNIVNIIDHEDGPLIINDNGDLYRLFSNNLELLTKREMYSGLIYNVELKDDFLYISTGHYGLSKINVARGHEHIFEPVIMSTKDFVLAEEGEAFVTGHYFRVIDIESKKMKSIRPNYFKKISYDFKNRNIWINTNDSLYVFDNDKNNSILKVVPFPLIENMKYLGEGKIIITTFENQMYVCDFKSCEEIIINNNVHVGSINVEDEKIWLNTDDGIFVASSSIESLSGYSFVPYFDYASLQSDVIVNTVLVTDEYTLLGTEEGLIKVNEIEIIDQKMSIPLDIEYNGPLKDKSNTYILDYTDRNVTINFSAKYFGNRNQLYYEYLLEGADGDTKSTVEEEIVFIDLASGDYSFKVRALDLLGNVGEYQQLDFKINKPWYHRPLVYILGLLLLIISGYLAFRSYMSRVNKKNELQQHLAELELSALQSQMNPHFVFNAMNSIQNLITSDRPEEADLYVTRLARLMRKYLDSSKEKYIQLKEEIDIVITYLQLEELRFGDKITYEIDNRLEDSYLTKRIPATIVQPFVENALKHGLFHKKEKGKLWLRLYKDSEHICIEIEDNGIGRKRVKEIQDKSNRKHKSTGMRAIENKLEVLRKLDKIDIEYSVIDLFSGQESTGTKVIIRIRNK